MRIYRLTCFFVFCMTAFPLGAISQENTPQRTVKVTHYYVPKFENKTPQAKPCHSMEAVCKFKVNNEEYIYNYTGRGTWNGRNFPKHLKKHRRLVSKAKCKFGIGYGISTNCTHPCRSLAASRIHHVPGQVLFFPELKGKQCGMGSSAIVHDGYMVINDTGSTAHFNQTGRFDFFWGDCYDFTANAVCKDGNIKELEKVLNDTKYEIVWSPENPEHNKQLIDSFNEKVRKEAKKRGDIASGTSFDLREFNQGGKIHKGIGKNYYLAREIYRDIRISRINTINAEKKILRDSNGADLELAMELFKEVKKRELCKNKPPKYYYSRWQGYPVQLCRYPSAVAEPVWTYFLNAGQEKLAFWVVSACKKAKANGKMKVCIKEVAKRMKVAATWNVFPIAGLVPEKHGLGCYLFRDGVTIKTNGYNGWPKPTGLVLKNNGSIKIKGKCDKFKTDHNIEPAIWAGKWARVASTGRGYYNKYYPAAGRQEVGKTSGKLPEQLNWLNVSRYLYQNAWDSVHNELIYLVAMGLKECQNYHCN